MSRRSVAMLLGSLLLAAACNSDASPDVTVDSEVGDGSLSAEVASSDVVAGRGGRLLVGVFSNDNERLLAYGTTRFSFAYLGTKDDPTDRERPEMTTDATYSPIPGQKLDRGVAEPRLVPGSQSIGVYGSPDVTFDRPGFWEVTVTAPTEEGELTATTTFEVVVSSNLPAAGDPAPATEQLLASVPGVSLTAVDSRAGDGESIPDPELHDLTIKQALVEHRPMMVVVSTPTYCQSRFCGPITDEVAALAAQGAGDVAFIHLEIWKDFEAGVINKAAAEWILEPEVDDTREPWVFTVDRAGIIRQRFDNVATAVELAAALDELSQ